MGHTINLPPEQIDAAIKLYDMGYSLNNIGKLYGMSADYIRSILHDNGVSTNRRTHSPHMAIREAYYKVTHYDATRPVVEWCHSTRQPAGEYVPMAILKPGKRNPDGVRDDLLMCGDCMHWKAARAHQEDVIGVVLGGCARHGICTSRLMGCRHGAPCGYTHSVLASAELIRRGLNPETGSPFRDDADRNNLIEWFTRRQLEYIAELERANSRHLQGNRRLRERRRHRKEGPKDEQ